MSVAEPDFDKQVLHLVDDEDIETEIMAHHPHLLDGSQEDDFEHPCIAPHKPPPPSPPAPVTHTGPAAAKPETHLFLKHLQQNREAALPSPPPLTYSPGPDSPRVKSSFAHRHSSRQDRLKATPSLIPTLVKRSSFEASATPGKPVDIPRSATHKDPTLLQHPASATHQVPSAESDSHEQRASRKYAADRQPRQRHRVLCDKSEHDLQLSRQPSKKGNEEKHRHLNEKMSDLSLGDGYAGHEGHEFVLERARRQQSSIGKGAWPGRHVEQVEAYPHRHVLHEAEDADLSHPHSRNAHRPPTSAVADDSERRREEEQTLSTEWEDEIEKSFEHIPSDLNHEIYHGYQQNRTTDQELVYQTLVIAEASAKITVTLGAKAYETAWTSQRSQRMRRSALSKVRRASRHATRVVMTETPLGKAHRSVRHVLKASPCSASEAVQWSVSKAAGLPVVGKFAKKASVALNMGEFATTGGASHHAHEPPEPATDQGWELLEEPVEDVFQKSVMPEPVSKPVSRKSRRPEKGIDDSLDARGDFFGDADDEEMDFFGDRDEEEMDSFGDRDEEML